MLKFITRNMLKGLVTILPVALTIYLLYWIAVSAESALDSMIRSIFPEALHWPGIGLIATLTVAFVVGLLMKMPMWFNSFLPRESKFFTGCH